MVAPELNEKSFGDQGGQQPDLEGAPAKPNSQKFVDISPLHSSSSYGNSPNVEEEPQGFYNDDPEANAVQREMIKRRLSRGSAYQTVEEQKAILNVLTSRRSHDTTPMPSMGGDRPLPPSPPDHLEYQVEFDGPDDPRHPFNWPASRKAVIVAILGFVTFTSSWGSSVFSPVVGIISETYHVRYVVASLTISLYVMGFASGPIIWSPISELYGRKLPLVIATLLFTCFSFACATAKDIQTVIITRFFMGMAGSAPLTLVAAVFADMFSNVGIFSRGVAINIFAVAVFAGPMVSPIAGGFIVQSYLSYRWTMYLTGIMGGASFLLVLFFVKETYPPLILVGKAEEMRRRTGNWGIHAVQEHIKIDIHEIVTNSIARPLKMVVTEPIILLIAIYNGFTYLILYLCLSSYPYAFMRKYHWNGGVVMLPYLGILTGEAICMLINVFYFERKYTKAARAGKDTPEMRLLPVLPAALCFPIGLFWFFWSANYGEHVHWIVPTLSGIFTGYGLMGILVPCMNYIVDSYLYFAASALASLTLVRSMFGAAAPLFSDYMFDAIHLNWSGLLLGLVAVALAPVPFLFYKRGRQIRSKSKYAFTEK